MNPECAIEHYLIRFLEERHPQFSNMSPGPFASKERLKDRIVYQEVHISKELPKDRTNPRYSYL